MFRKRVYLTIDDSPSKDFNKKVHYLHSRNIGAIFFCIGKNLLEYEDDVVDAIKRGFIIGNHSYEHSYFSDMSLEACRDSIIMTDEIIDSLYLKSEVNRPFKLFRFPFFDQGGDMSSEEYEEKWTRPNNEWFIYKNAEKRAEIQRFLKALGYAQPDFKGINMKYFTDKSLLKSVDIRCTFDQMEYFLGKENAPYGMDKEENILNRIDEDFPYEGRALNCIDTADIILVHDHENTTELFYKIVDRYIERQFQFLSL